MLMQQEFTANAAAPARRKVFSTKGLGLADPFDHNLSSLEPHHLAFTDHHTLTRSRIASLARSGHLYSEHAEVPQFDTSRGSESFDHAIKRSLHNLTSLIARHANLLRDTLNHAPLRSNHCYLLQWCDAQIIPNLFQSVNPPLYGDHETPIHDAFSIQKL